MEAKTDSAIKEAVLRELKWDTRVKDTEVGVEVDGGIVTLTGTVGSWAKRQAAQVAAHRVAGVLDVANDIEVRVSRSGLNDTDIARAVRHALEWNVFVPDKRIRSTVSDGVVTLEGDVDCGSEREDAERAVRDLAGVRSVLNRLDVRVQPVEPKAVRQAIEQALERQAEREGRNLDIQVRDGHVSVSGVVRSLREREAVLGAARGTAGVRNVDSHLRIDPYAA